MIERDIYPTFNRRQTPSSEGGGSPYNGQFKVIRVPNQDLQVQVVWGVDPDGAIAGYAVAGEDTVQVNKETETISGANARSYVYATLAGQPAGGFTASISSGTDYPSQEETQELFLLATIAVDTTNNKISKIYQEQHGEIHVTRIA